MPADAEAGHVMASEALHVADASGRRAEMALEVTSLSKRFGGVQALDNFHIRIKPGTIHGLCGENGSGKSTLVKSLTGYHVPDPGYELRIYGRKVGPDPTGRRLAVVHQDLGLAEDMTVAENVGTALRFGCERPWSPVRSSRERRRAAALGRQIGLDVDVTRRVGDLSPAQRAAVAIMRAMRMLQHAGEESQLLVLDEPTAFLTTAEVKSLFRVLRRVVMNGSSILLISHRLREVIEICDEITVIRDGRHVRTIAAAETNSADLLQLMLGRRIESFYPDRHGSPRTDVALTVDGVHCGGEEAVSMAVRSGEIVGVTGLEGMGQDILPYAVFGAPGRDGSVEVDGRRLSDGSSIRRRMEHGLGLVPANRHRDGMWVGGTVLENLTMPRLASFFRRGLLRRSIEEAFADEAIRRYEVRPRDHSLVAASLSGGNQQKVVFGKVLSLNPRVLLLHEPTNAVDAGAKSRLLQEIVDVADAGSAVVLCSIEYEDLAYLCDRVLIMFNGVIAAELRGEDVTEANILFACQSVASTTLEAV